MPSGQRWDIFCTVIDNYGDIGITWRLARQLADEYGLQVRLWIDDLDSFRRIQPGIDPALERQSHAGVEVCRWFVPFPHVEPADVVVEALACHLPESYEQAMAARAVKPVWINLEYLSAEGWVAGCHGLPSPHPRLPLTKHFFMPGYTVGTGGVLKEAWLAGRRNAFQASRAALDDFWRSLGLPDGTRQETRISLFSYESTAIQSLFQSWSQSAEPIRCLVPEGRSLGDVAHFFGRTAVARGDCLTLGQLTVQVLPMLDLDGYDRLLWACDCNFVRGEDSFVRAMWSGTPLVWQAYRQEDGAHWPKIQAFLDSYCAGMDAVTADPLRRLWQAWNEDGDAGPAWASFWQHRAYWLEHSVAWQASLDRVGDLAGNLVKFCNEKIK